MCQRIARSPLPSPSPRGSMGKEDPPGPCVGGRGCRHQYNRCSLGFPKTSFGNKGWLSRAESAGSHCEAADVTFVSGSQKCRRQGMWRFLVSPGEVDVAPPRHKSSSKRRRVLPWLTIQSCGKAASHKK